MKVRTVKTSSGAEPLPKQDAQIAELQAQLAAAFERIDKLEQENARKLWTWCFRAEFYTLFRIQPSRGSEVLIDTLGDEFNGVLGCDYFGAYRKYMRKFDVLVQFCLAHLIRDVRFLATLPDKKQKAYGERIREALRELFAVIHRRDTLTESGFARKLEAARAEVVRVATTRVPQGKDSFRNKWPILARRGQDWQGR